MHRATRRGECGTAGVFETLSGFEQWLVSDDAESFYFLRLLVGIGDDPMAADELCRHRAAVDDGDGVGKHKSRFGRAGLILQILGAYADCEFVFVHRAVILSGHSGRIDADAWRSRRFAD